MKRWLCALALVAPSTSSALLCDHGGADVFPADLSTDVPLNTRVVVTFPAYQEGNAQWALQDDETGEVVPTVASRTVQLNEVFVTLVPVEPLLPNHDYLVVEVEDALRPYFAETLFTTGTTVDTTSPGEPTITDSGVEANRALLLEPEFMATALNWWSFQGTEDNVIFEVEFSPTEDLQDAATLTTFQRRIEVGWGGCLLSDVQMDFGERWFARVRAVDMAGNASDWSEPQRAARGSGGGCATLNGPPKTWWWLGLAVLGVVRRRR